jgi:hypothetical protein
LCKVGRRYTTTAIMLAAAAGEQANNTYLGDRGGLSLVTVWSTAGCHGDALRRPPDAPRRNRLRRKRKKSKAGREKEGKIREREREREKVGRRKRGTFGFKLLRARTEHKSGLDYFVDDNNISC